MTTDATIAQLRPHTDRITRWLLIAIGIYNGLLVTLLNIFLLGSGKTIDFLVQIIDLDDDRIS